MSGHGSGDERRTPDERLMLIGDDLWFRVLDSTTASLPVGPAFVLVHGIGVSHRYLARLHRELARTSHVYSIDLPGFSGLPKPQWSPTVPEMSRALGEVLDKLGVAPTVLVGHSMGSQWVVELAAQRPELATHVAAMSPVTDSDHRSLTAQAAALAVDTLAEPPSGNALVFGDYALRCGPAWYLAQAPHMIRYRIEDRVQTLARPLLVLRGGSDPVAGLEWCRRLRANAVNGALVQVPGHRHLVQHTAPRTVASALRAFVRDPSLASERMP